MQLFLLGAALALGSHPEPGIPAPPQDREPTEADGARDETEAHPDRLALVVGIDAYSPGTEIFRPLKGCLNDARRVRDVLVERFDFAPDDVLTLLNEEATVEGMVTAFEEHLIRRAGPETEVLFWFSGHGSRVPDASAREPGRLDSSLVAWDSRTAGRDGSYDLSDDLIGSLRLRLSEVTERVTFVTDACHSGGITRGAREEAPRVRGASAGTEPVDLSLFEPFWPADVEVIDDDDPRHAKAGGYVHIAACHPEQQAQEIDLEDGVAHGALTFFLTRGLIDAQPGTSYAALARDAGARLSTRFPAQTIWLEGALDRMVFGARFARRPEGHAARAFDATQLTVAAGTMLGLQKGSKLKILGELDGRELGTAVVKRASTVSAVAEWEGDPPSPLPEGALRAVEESRPAGQDPLPVHVTTAELIERVGASPLVERCTAGHPDAYVIGMVDGAVTFLSPQGVTIWTEPEERAQQEWALPRIRPTARELLEEVRDELTYRSLLALSLEDGALELDARFVPPSEEELEDWSDYPDAGIEDLGGGGWSPAGPVFRVAAPGPDEAATLGVLAVENTSDRPAYVAIVSVMEDRSRYVVWPHLGKKEALPAGRTLRVPIGIQSSATWNLPRAMRDHYIVFATTAYADFSVLEREPEEPRTRGQQQDSNLPELIRDAVRGPMTRGSATIGARADDWGVTRVDLLVEAPRPAPAAR